MENPLKTTLHFCRQVFKISHREVSLVYGELQRSINLYIYKNIIFFLNDFFIYFVHIQLVYTVHQCLPLD